MTNVQVLVDEASVLETKLSLVDDNGVFVETDTVRHPTKGGLDRDELFCELEESSF